VSRQIIGTIPISVGFYVVPVILDWQLQSSIHCPCWRHVLLALPLLSFVIERWGSLSIASSFVPSFVSFCKAFAVGLLVHDVALLYGK
jgi:hypothetical protein